MMKIAIFRADAVMCVASRRGAVVAVETRDQ